MSSSKFIIGLGTSVPSTRVLKPPGGESSDLFGLITRQKAILHSFKKPSGSLCGIQIQELSDDSQKQSKKQEEYCGLKKSFSEVVNAKPAGVPSYPDDNCSNPKQFKQTEGKENHILKSSKGSENLLSLYENDATKTTHQLERNLKNAQSLISAKDYKSFFAKANMNYANGFQKYGRRSVLENEANGYALIQSPYKTIARNPITGILKGIESCDQKRGIHSKDGSIVNKRPAGIKAKKSAMDVGLGCSRRRYQTINPRNPITGERTKDEHHKLVPRGISVLQPPGGGITCGS